MYSTSLMLIAILIAIYANVYSNKRKKLNELTDFIYTDFKEKIPKVSEYKSVIIDSLALGIGSSAMNIIDIYSAVDNHEELLGVLAQRYPNMLEGYSSEDWFNKISDLKDNNSLETYVSAYKGQISENISVKFLEEEGYKNVKLFDSLTHENNDVIGEMHGESIEFSVKNGSVDYIKNSIENHPESSNYIVNEEAFNNMLTNGELDKFADDGITILNGEYSLDELSSNGYNALSDIYDAGDLIDDIPWIAIAIFGVKTIKNIREYNRTKQSSYELRVNISIDAGRVASGGVFAAGGAKLGMALGTMVTPGVGSIIGGGIGIICGAIAGGQIFNKMKDQFKWGEIISALDYFGDKYNQNYSLEMRNEIEKQLFNYSEVIEKLNSELKILEKYKKELSLFSFKKPTIEAVMAKEHYNNLCQAKSKIESSVKAAANEIRTFTDNIVFKDTNVKQRSINMRKTSMRLATDIILNNKWLFSKEQMNTEELKLLDRYYKKIKVAPNHPYSLDVDKQELFKGIIYKKYDEKENHLTELSSLGSILLYFMSIGLAVLSVYSFVVY